MKPPPPVAPEGPKEDRMGKKVKAFTCFKCGEAKEAGCRATVTEDGPLCFGCDREHIRCCKCQGISREAEGVWVPDGAGSTMMVCAPCAARPSKQTALAAALAALDAGEFFLDDVLDHAARREARGAFARVLLDRLTAQELDTELATRRVSATDPDGTQAAQLALAFNSRQ